ncbi:tRNA (guanosine(46)-N7)-methyltransferase TrmB [Clostridium sp. MSJ-11]|uniref:tRNA (guanine-N(7)-)-methyltransferase n=1 Tax=Clostridium mobile TaxID=2841512 RepID=A0ABS6EKA3_9CLOT|nr:tRNA (guanosine(46)-N7)-methyltransferase TrmB [Clostridium mobile]MBU5485641.1 tRNA (guanosine(46)-N7)-methyltransferase TrmB [Clostridium mobile]
MRLRKKWWARPEMEASDLIITNPRDYKGKWREEFKNENPIHLELGCGKGGFISKLGDKFKDTNYVAVDLKDEILVYVKRQVEELELTNVRIIPLNIMFISEVFEENEVEKIYINFCNPWPKDRHNKRRLTHTNFLNEYKKFLKPGSEVWFKTDDRDLFDDSQEYFKEAGFNLEYVTYDLHNSGFKENIMTEYEEKFSSQGMKIMFLIGKVK